MGDAVGDLSCSVLISLCAGERVGDGDFCSINAGGVSSGGGDGLGLIFPHGPGEGGDGGSGDGMDDAVDDHSCSVFISLCTGDRGGDGSGDVGDAICSTDGDDNVALFVTGVLLFIISVSLFSSVFTCDKLSSKDNSEVSEPWPLQDKFPSWSSSISSVLITLQVSMATPLGIL